MFDEDNVLISAGEIVAAHDNMDMHWYRAKVLQCDRSQIMVRKWFNSRELLVPTIEGVMTKHTWIVSCNAVCLEYTHCSHKYKMTKEHTPVRTIDNVCVFLKSFYFYP